MLEVVYLLFNEGYAATAGEEWQRPELCRDALRLGRVLAELLPAEPEVHGLVALMEIQASRSAARRGPAGEPVLLLDQDRARWDRLLIRRGLAALAARAAARPAASGPTACRPRSPRATPARPPPPTPTGRRSSRSTTRSPQLAPSPVVSLNRAVAVAMAYGPAAALEIVDELAREPALERYHLLPSVRGELLARLGRPDDARVEFERAASLTANERERDAAARPRRTRRSDGPRRGRGPLADLPRARAREPLRPVTACARRRRDAESTAATAISDVDA